MLEREAQLGALLAAVADARAGHGCVVVVDGEAGIGKTSLVREFLARAGRDVHVLVGGCDDLWTRRPLGPLRDAIEGAGGPLEAAVDAGRPELVFAAAVAELDRPPVTVLVVEDVHWVDDATLDVLRHVARRVHDLCGVVVLTVRSGEVGPAHPLRALLGDLAGARRLRPEPLSAAAITELTGSAEDADAVLALTGGNPFFVTELLAAPPGQVPRTVGDAVAARLGRLPDECRAAVAQLSVVPTQIGFDLAEDLLGGQVDVLDEAERGGILLVRGTGLAFRHELARRAIEARLPVLRRRQLNSAVVAALLRTPRPDLDRVLHHAIEAGDTATVARYAPDACRAAARVGAHRQALAHAEVALQHAELLDVAAHARLLDDYAWELYNARRFAEAVEAGAEAVRRHADLGDRSALGVALVHSSRHLYMAGATDAAEEAATRAVSVLSDAPRTELAYALTQYGSLLALTEQSREAIAVLDRARAFAEGGPRSGEVAATCLNYQGVARTELDGPVGLGLLRESLDLSLDGGLDESVARAYTNLAELLYRLGRYDELAQCLKDGLAYTLDRDFWSHAYNLRIHHALLQLRHGEWPEAAAALEALAGEADEAGMLAVYCVPPHARMLARTERPEAEPLLWTAWERAVAQRSFLGQAFAGTAIAEWAWLTGQPDRAAPVVDELTTRRDRVGATPVLGELLRYLARAGTSVEALAGCPEPWAAGLRGDWRAAADGWAEIGDPYERALELAESGEPEPTLEALRVLDGLGATAAATLVRERLAALGVARIPRGPAATTRANPAGLTDRQLAVLALLAEGLTNAEIAKRLVLSVRTVDHHVAAVLEKLGVSSRRAAAQFWAEQ